MIGYDSSEYRQGSTMPEIPGAVSVPSLESMTGADLIISASDMPMSKPALLKEHLENDAILIQVKRNMDLAASVGERLEQAIIKMREVARKQNQRGLLFIGTLGKDHDGRAIIDGRKVDENIPGVNHKACYAAMRNWIWRGGIVYPSLSIISHIPDWAIDMESGLKQCLSDPVKFFYPAKPLLETEGDDPFQTPVKIDDWRVPMSYLIGPKKTQLLAQAAGNNGAWAFDAMSDPKFKLPKGIYDSDRAKFRQRMKFEDNQKLAVELIRNGKDEY